MCHQDWSIEVLRQQMLEWQLNFLWNGTNVCLRSDQGIFSFLVMFWYIWLGIVLSHCWHIEQFRNQSDLLQQVDIPWQDDFSLDTERR